MYYTSKYRLQKDMMTTAQSRILNRRVPASAVKMFLSTMRSLGFILTAVTLILVALLAANAEPVDRTAGGTELHVPGPVPHWNGVYAKTFPGCTDKGDFIPARIVVVPREGAARTMRYSNASVSLIDATWDNDDPADDLYTIGKCAR